MDPITHVLTSVLAVEVVAPGVEIEPWALAAATGASLAPDIDFLSRRLDHTGLLRYHHAATHSLIGGSALAAAWAGLLAIVSPVGWPVLFMYAWLGLCSHLALDILLHNNGLLLGWPFSRRRVRGGWFLGLNPLTSSARCGERRLTICLACQAHSLLYNRVFLILVATTVCGLLAFPFRRLVFTAGGILLLVWIGHTMRNRVRATRLAAPKLGNRAGVYPASFDANDWIAVSPTAEGAATAHVDLRSGTVGDPIRHITAPTRPIEETKSRPAVQALLANAVVPFAEIAPGGEELWWRDLSYDAAPDVLLHTLRLRVEEGGQVSFEEFRERW